MYSFSLGRLSQRPSGSLRWSWTTCLGVRASHCAALTSENLGACRTSRKMTSSVPVFST